MKTSHPLLDRPRPEAHRTRNWDRSPYQLDADPTMQQLAHGHWVHDPLTPTHDDVAPLPAWQRAALMQPTLGPDVAVAHISAAQIWGIPLSAGMRWVDELLGEYPPSKFPDDVPHLAYRGARRNQVTRSFAMHKSFGFPLSTGPWGCQLTHALETVLSLQALLAGWRCVAALDHVLSTGLNYANPGEPCSQEELARLLTRLPAGTRGIAVVRRALERSEPGVWSPMETVLRLALLHHGIPPAQANVSVRLTRGGRVFIDLAWADVKVGLEYNGAVHAQDRDVYGDEMDRLNQLADDGWKIRVVVLEDLRDPQRFAALLRWLKAALA
ncbi:hypothetical protein [Kocuria sp.]|uniref:hypothetical protein n=1 Tax=Kocuria sp. TaxID=1871328 RepID=UPI0026E06696|nr:hypothetical protein [Kocuria sp.]MDO5618485.1 hypothetical protein [Kocuria sp.]